MITDLSSFFGNSWLSFEFIFLYIESMGFEFWYSPYLEFLP